jgi:colanic acid biosynthesis glycosyl transferase WcaI
MTNPKPSILFISENYPPENFAAALRVYERGLYWKNWGYNTQFLTSFPNRHHGKDHVGYSDKLYKDSKEDGLQVLRVKTYIPKRKGIFFRALHQLSFMISVFLGGLLKKKTSIIIATTPQFFCSFSGLLLSKIKRVPFVLEVADIWTTSIKLTIIKDDSLFFTFLLRLEEFIYKRSDAIVVLTEGFKNEISERGISKDKIYVIRNGVNKAREVLKKTIDLRKEYNLQNKFIIGYAGSLGTAQGLINLVEAAEILHTKKIENVSFVIIGEGDNKEDLEKRSEHLDNIIFLGSRPKEMITEFMSSFNLGIAHLNSSPVWKTTIPSKIFEMMSFSLPILLVSPQGEASGLINLHKCGVCVPAGNPEALAQCVIDIISDPLKMQDYARNSLVASKSFRRDVQAQKMIDVVEKVISSKMKDI